jgi:hypothetical protein
MPEHYEIKIKAYLNPRWSERFADLRLTHLEGGDLSLLSGSIHDQAALHGLLDRIRELNLTLVSVTSVVPAHGGGVRDSQRWAPYAAVAWSLIYAALGVYWAVSGRGFPYTPENVSDGMGSVERRPKYFKKFLWIFSSCRTSL